MARDRMCLGIDIGASSVKLCQLRATKQGFALMSFGLVPLPSEAVVDGALMNSPRIVEAIQELVAAHKIKHKQVAISVSGHSVIIKKIPLPQMSREELEESIQWEAEQFIPFDINDVNIDVQIVNPKSAQQGQMDVVLVAAKKAAIDARKPLRALIEEGIRMRLAKTPGGRPGKIRWVVAAGGAPLEVRDREAMYEWLRKKE